ncbi:MAG: FtsH protease activity modulator HflK [Candidatus Electrothrix aestuarii]|uniref:Protein HflK n=1 Tax=Candidatus Electrothrix aestuarii TaxID=3062594 RepID=A0AAU8LQP6_9BACT|nr:FtsH protease activity modulator HflK [Candidatus Electrothrix aestuarii]
MNDQSPWGKKKKPGTPEDFLAVLIQKIRDAFNEEKQEGPSSQKGGDPEPVNFLAGIGKVILVIFAVVCFQVIYSSFYTIESGEQGVVLRFGQYHRTTEPGLHFKMPYIEHMERVDVKTVRKEEFGFRTKAPGQNSTFSKEGFDRESLMLTGDKNVIDVAWIVQYTVSDPVRFLFKVRQVKQAVRDNSETVIRRIVGNMDFDYVLGNRSVLAEMAKQELQKDLDKLESGVHVGTLQLLDITPTDAVKPAFNEVNEADQDMKRLVNEAEETYNKVIPKARGSAKQIIEEAHGYAVQRVNDAKGETVRFNAIVAEYLKAEEVTRRRMYLETMQEILPHAKQIYVMDGKEQAVLPFMNLTDNGQTRTSSEQLRSPLNTSRMQ